MHTRRQFLSESLKMGSVISLASSVPCFLSRSLQAVEEANNDGRILVVIELSGGNDGLNTVIPYSDESYEKFRRTLRVPASAVLKLNDEIGLHPALAGAAKLIEEGRLAIVQGVGYPNPNRSHFESAAIWHSAQLRPGDHGGFGWLGRALDVNSHRIRTFADAIAVGDLDPPPALRGRHATQSTIRNLEDLQLDLNTTHVGSTTEEPESEDLLQFVRHRTVDAQATAARIARLSNKRESSIAYPGSDLANRLKTIARLIRAELEPRVYYTVQSGYDTHVMQYDDHYQLLAQFSGTLKAFLDDLQEAQLADRVLVLVFSEFGRRVEENDSQGTDHGTAGPMFLAGPAVKAGLHGQNPDLSNLEDGDLTMTVDFRSVYATVLSEWLQVDPAQCLHGHFETTNLLES
jgi:uncharacterized protein (DUF1501 family)